MDDLPTEITREPEAITPPIELCGATNRNLPGTCKKRAGWGTNHVGQGRCRLHGGNNAIKSGIHSKITRPRIATLIAEFEQEPEPLNISGELILLRALAVDFIERYDQWRDALFAWHESWKTGNGEASKPTQILDIVDAYKIVAEITKVTDRQERLVLEREKLKAMEAISRPDLLRILTEMTRVVELYTPEPERREQIQRGWTEIRLA